MLKIIEVMDTGVGTPGASEVTTMAEAATTSLNLSPFRRLSPERSLNEDICQPTGIRAMSHKVYTNQSKTQNYFQNSQAIATTPLILPGQDIKNKNLYILPNE